KPAFREVHADGGKASAARTRKKIRDISRLLAKPESKLTATARRENERALAALKDELASVLASNQDKKIAQKYHMVRFFERRKATRKVVRFEKNAENRRDLASNDDYIRALAELAYTVLSPRDEKYIALYADGASEDPKRAALLASFEEQVRAGQIHSQELMFGQ
ncbi:uncharacterized protein V1510DRAFT_349780, partial [Dipodascopsis tothii]|uniref:uncharacterized protein n=1 Tax=Dipodascopsis tothii TaxID=44089 RepID=UPI0034CDCA50